MAKTKLEKQLLEEVSRYNAINAYTIRLNEQAVPPQLDPNADPNALPPAPAGGLPPAPGAEAPPAGGLPPAPGAEVPAPEEEPSDKLDLGADDDAEAKTDVDPASDDTTEEMDITDLVNLTKNIKQDLENSKVDNSGVTQKMDDVFSKLTDLEAKLGEMDSVLAKIDELGAQVQQMKPPTQVEKLEMRSLDSFPYNQKPDEFFAQKQGEMKASGKNEYVLTKDDVNNYSRDQITKSFNPNKQEFNDVTY